MSIPQRLLNEGEHVVVSTRTHVKSLVVPVLVLLVSAFLAGYLWTVGEGTAADVLHVGVVVVAVVVVLWWVVRPFVKWLSTTYTFTNRRFISRSGFIAKEGRTIPLNRISGVDFEVGYVDRIFGCGTLVVSDASEQGRVELHDIPRVEQVQMVVAEELHRIADRRADDGT